MRHAVAATVLLVVSVSPALAEDANPVEALTDPTAISDAAASGLEALQDASADKVMVSAMMGRKVRGPGGETLGTLEDLVVIPGGKIVAILVRPDEGEPVALPYQALKVSGAASAAGEAGLSLPVGLDEARAMEGMQALTSAVLDRQD